MSESPDPERAAAPSTAVGEGGAKIEPPGQIAEHQHSSCTTRPVSRHVKEHPNTQLLHELIGELANKKIADGCDLCDAYQIVALTGYGARITIHHDDNCPVLKHSRSRR